MRCTGTRVALLLLLFACACKQRGEWTIDLDIPESCPEATHVQLLLIPGVLCASCACDECVAPCAGGECQLACPDGPCPIEALDDGLRLLPEQPGLHAVVFELIEMDDGGTYRVVGTACADVELDADGTASHSVTAAATCCPP